MSEAPVFSRPFRGISPTYSATEISETTENDLEKEMLSEAKRISKYLGFSCPPLIHDSLPTQYDFDSQKIFLNRFWKENCKRQLGIEAPTAQDVKYFATFCVAHELAHRFQHEFIDYDLVDRAPELFECHADLVAAHLYRDRFQLAQESARFLVPAASSLQAAFSALDYPPGCVRGYAVAVGMMSLAFANTDGALNEPKKFFLSSICRAFELVVGSDRMCELGRDECVGCRGKDLNRLKQRFSGPSFNSANLSDGVESLVELYDKYTKGCVQAS